MTMPTDEIRLEALAQCVDWVRENTGEPGTGIIREPIKLVRDAREELRLVMEVLRAADHMLSHTVSYCGVNPSGFRQIDFNAFFTALAALRSVR